ncbi:MAG: SRPBCC family protein [Fermentimonas sp.]|nr:SRPBCC family protein [Fermentimonas sp.]
MIPINKKAPVKAQKSIEIDATIEKVWDLLSDINRWPEWNPDIKKAKLNGDLNPGSTFDWENGGMNISSTLHTVVFQEYFGWSGKAFGAYAIHNWQLKSSDGKTEVFVEESMDGLLMRIFRGYMNNTLEKGMVNWLIYLKEEAEK